MFQSLCFLDEVNVDYSRLLKTTAVEGLRVEDLVKKYFEAAEQVLYTHGFTFTCLQDVTTLLFTCRFYRAVFWKVCVHTFADSAAVPPDRAGNGEGHSGVRRQRWERRHWGADHLPVREDTAPPPGQRSNHRAGYWHRGNRVGLAWTEGQIKLLYDIIRVHVFTFSDPAIQRLQKEHNWGREWNQRSK